MAPNFSATKKLKEKRDEVNRDFHDPSLTNGSWLTGIESPGLGEPLNGVVSALSDPNILKGGLWDDWLRSVGYSYECLGVHMGGYQTADLGDGNGYLNQSGIGRLAYGYYAFGGTCYESFIGGDHVRWWVQNGNQSDTGAIFLALSSEQNSTLNHMLIDDGYNLGRDWFVGNATLATGTTSPTTGIVYNATVNMAEGFLKAGTDGINHAIPIDGKLAVLNVQIQSWSGVALAPWSGVSLFFFILLILLLGYLLSLSFHPSRDYTHLLPDSLSESKISRRAELRGEIREITPPSYTYPWTL